MEPATRAVAIVGVGAILPDAPTVPIFWQNILDRRYSIADVPPERWSLADYYDPDPTVADKSYSKIGGWVRGFVFDWQRFRIPPRVVAAMDQAQQWAVTVAADALADYGYPDRPLDTERTGVILGTAMGGELHYETHLRIMYPQFAHLLQEADAFAALPAVVQQEILGGFHANVDRAIPPITEDSMPGELPNVVSGRVANVLNLRGPNFIADAACASSIAALNAAVEMLYQGQADAIITGGIDRNMGASTFVKFCKIGALSATGTRPFGDGADGFVMGEGAAAFLLKRLEDAERDGDRIYAVIRGVGGSSDGKGKGITAPNPIGQQLAIQRAWQNAGLDPATATLIEAHGTSTRVGDVVELESLAEVFCGAPRQSIALGSVKSNIGHLKAGAGAAGLLKATLALHHRILPPTLHADPPNPAFDFAGAPFYLNHQPREWRQREGTPRRCAVSAYGFGGTNWHVVLEEHRPGELTRPRKAFAAAELQGRIEIPTVQAAPSQEPAPLRGILALGAPSAAALADRLEEAQQRVQGGWTPPRALPGWAELEAPERLVIDFGDQAELLERLGKAQKAFGYDTPEMWKALSAQGIFRGRGAPAGKVAYLFPGQGSQYVNMGRELAAASPVVAAVFAEADAVMTPILGRPLTSTIFVDAADRAAVAQATMDLMQTEITQPAMLTLDMALLALLQSYGFAPDMVMGHSLGEYAALIAAGVISFAHALEAVAARGSEMSRVSVADNGKMAAVIAPFAVIEETLAQVDGYVVPANINSHSQAVIGGASRAVEQAVALFEKQGYQAIPLPVSHAFHTEIVAPASAPLRQMLDRLAIHTPRLPLVANVTGDFYPAGAEAIKDLLQQQIASPVQWVRGLERLYAAGARTFVEVGPKRALRGFANDVFGAQDDVTALITNHPKTGELPTFNQALCGLFAAGYGRPQPAPTDRQPAVVVTTGREDGTMHKVELTIGANGDHLSPETPIQSVQAAPAVARTVYDRNEPPTGSVVISGTGLGLPGAEKGVMDPDNALRILHGEQFVDLIPERFRQKMVDKRITRLVKDEDGSGSFETINTPDEVIKLAGRPGSFDLTEEYGVSAKLVEALDITSQLAMAAGIDALREAGIPLVQNYRRTSTGSYLPGRWTLPPALQDETGVIFASAFPGGDQFAAEFSRYYRWQGRLDALQMLEELRPYTSDEATLHEIGRRIARLREEIEAEPYTFDRRFLFRILSMGHSQFAQYIGARGPNTQVNGACASTAQAIAIAEDWIRSGRCRRVVVIAADDVTGDNLMEWVGAGFLAVGAATTSDRVSEAALPFDRRRHGTIMGMGACALVVESQDAVAERGMRGIVELLSSEMGNSAFHGTRLDVGHIAQVMNSLISAAERRFGLNRQAMAPETVFVSHETFTPARGGSAAAEVVALRETFGEAASEIIIANTKGFTGHPMGVGVEDVIAVKILEHGIVPPVPNFREVDPELGPLNLSRGGRYPVTYAIHLAAGFGSQIALTLTRRLPGAPNRTDQPARYRRWLEEISGCNRAELEVEKRVLRVKATGQPERAPAPSSWQAGTGPQLRCQVGGAAAGVVIRPARMRLPEPQPAPVYPSPEPVAVAVASAPVAVRPAPSAVAPVALAPQPAAVVEAAPEPPVSPASADDIAGRVLAIVAAQTGYPPEMLELDLSLEADLGVDTVKQAETFLSIREAFDIPRQENLKLSDYPTLAHVIRFVREQRPELAAAVVVPAAITAAGDDAIAERVLSIVAEQTGYPPEMLELDLNLEADLGVDTVKQAETFLSIRQAFDIPRQENLKLSDYPTLAHVIQFVREQRPDVAGPMQPVSEAPAVQEAPVQPPAPADDVTERVLAIVAEQTGYPPEMLELDLNLEADLGVDTVKQAETFLSIRQAFDIPRRENLKLSDYPTLAHVIQFVREQRVDQTGGEEDAGDEEPAGETPALREEAAKAILHRVPVPSLRPALALCRPTGVALDEKSRVVVMPDRGGVGKALIRRLEGLGATALVPQEAADGDALQRQLEGWLAQGPIDGVFWLPALDEEPALVEMEQADWRRENQIRVRNLYTTMRALYDSVNRSGAFLVAGTRLGGLHGYGPQGAGAPLGGGVSGFAKAYGREQPDVLVKVVDFPASRKTTALADALIAETLYDPGVVEVGYPGAQPDERVTITLVEQPAGDGEGGLALNAETVFLVTGAAGGITSAIVADLAAHSGGTFYLLDLAEAPAAGDEQIALFRQDKEQLKQRLIAQATAAGERPTPVLIERQLLAVERREAAQRAVEAVTAAGGAAHYYSVNLLDGEAVAAVVEQIRQQEGRIDVLVHAAGVEISKPLPKKEPAEFDLVFGVKADGLFNLLKATADLPLGAVVVFSSVAGRFGNAGQTDYSAANDLLCKLVSSLRGAGETRGIAIDWTAWAGIGMATRGSIPKIMEMAGIEMLPPEAGVPTVRRELVSGPFSGEIVVAGRLGALTGEEAESGGLDVAKANAWLQAQQPPFLMVGELQAARLYGGLEATTVLDPREQPFLYDHALDGTPLLPGVMVTETFAQLAQVVAPGYRVVAVEDETFHSPFKFYRMEPQTLYLQAVGAPAGDELVVHTTLRSRRQLAGQEAPQEKLHFTATVRLARGGPEGGTDPAGEAIALLSPDDPALGAPEIRREAIYDIYFHGPAYQVLEGVQVTGQRAVGLMACELPPDSRPPDAASLMAPRLIELCFQTAGIWQIRTSGELALPASLASVSATRPLPAGEGRLWAVVEAIDGGAAFNADVVDDDGAVYLRLRGYRTVALPGKVELG